MNVGRFYFSHPIRFIGKLFIFWIHKIPFGVIQTGFYPDIDEFIDPYVSNQSYIKTDRGGYRYVISLFLIIFLFIQKFKIIGVDPHKVSIMKKTIVKVGEVDNGFPHMRILSTNRLTPYIKK